MNKVKKVIKISCMLSSLLLCLSPISIYAQENGSQPDSSSTESSIPPEKPSRPQLVDFQLSLVGPAIPSFQAGQSQKIGVQLTNKSTSKVTKVSIRPKVSAATNEWPFELENKDYSNPIGDLAANQSMASEWMFTARQDVSSTYNNLIFIISYFDGTSQQEVEKNIYVKTVADKNLSSSQSSQAEDKEEKPISAPAPEPAATDETTNEAGIMNSEVSFSGGGTPASPSSVPRVIVTGFTTDPKEVRAGSNFKLSIQVKNTSSTTAVRNMIVGFTAPTEGKDDNTGPAFLASSGANTIYIDSIAAGKEQTITMELNAKHDLIQKPYSIELAMKYEDSNSTQYDATSSLSIPIKQAARFEFAAIQLTPTEITVDQESNLTTNLYNLGKTKLFNAKVRIESKSVSANEIFLGNIDSGATATIDMMLKGLAETKEGEKVNLVFQYEDSDGKTIETKKEFEVKVVANTPIDVSEIEEPKESGFPILPIVIATSVLVAGISAWLWMRKKKAKDVDDDEFDGSFGHEQK